MHTLILLRHAKAVRDNEAPSDRARRLTGRGRRDAEAAGAALIAAGLRPDFALISAAMRTRETAHIALADIAPLEARVDESLYLAAPEAIWEAAVGCGGETVLVVGHNPGIHQITATLIAQAHEGARDARLAAEHMPTAAWAAFEIGGSLLAAAGPRFLAAWRPERSDD